MLFFLHHKRSAALPDHKSVIPPPRCAPQWHQVFQQQLSPDQIGFEVVSRSDAASRAGNGEKAHLKLICNAHFLLIFWHRRNHFLQQACKHQTIKSFFKTFPLFHTLFFYLVSLSLAIFLSSSSWIRMIFGSGR